MTMGFIDRAEVDFVINGRPDGLAANQLARVGFDPGLLRPMVMDDGKKYCWVHNGRQKKGPNGGPSARL